MKTVLAFFALVGCVSLSAQPIKGYDAIYSGVPWFDDKGNAVSAQGANIVKEGGKYYLFGERHEDETNAFVGFNCYSSTDLYNWKFEGIALPLQQEGKLGPNRVSFTVKGTQIDIYGLARPDGGYAGITIRNGTGKIILTSTIEMYSKYPIVLLKFLSPFLPKDSYTLTVSVLGENWWWVEKSGRRSGSKGYFVSIDRIVVGE